MCRSLYWQLVTPFLSVAGWKSLEINPSPPQQDVNWTIINTPQDNLNWNRRSISLFRKKLHLIMSFASCQPICSGLRVQCRFTVFPNTVYPKKYAHGFCFAVLCCGYTLTDFPISIRLTSLALWQSNDCPSASKATLINIDEYFMWIHYERLHNHNKAKHNKTVCIFLGLYCSITADSKHPLSGNPT